MSFNIEFELQPARDGLIVLMNGSQSIAGGVIPIDTGTVVPSYWCGVDGTTCPTIP